MGSLVDARCTLFDLRRALSTHIRIYSLSAHICQALFVKTSFARLCTGILHFKTLLYHKGILNGREDGGPSIRATQG